MYYDLILCLNAVFFEKLSEGKICLKVKKLF